MLENVKGGALSFKDRAGLSLNSGDDIALFHLFAIVNEHLTLNAAVDESKCPQCAVDSCQNALSLGDELRSGYFVLRDKQVGGKVNVIYIF